MNETDAIEQLAALLDGTADRNAAPSSLIALLSLAETVRDESDVLAPSADFRNALRAELIESIAPEATLVERTRAVWLARTSNLRSSARVAVATMTASSMLGTAGMAMAAQEAIPGDALYGLKTLTEQTRLMLATDELAEARLQLAFAAERLEELERGAATMTSDQIVALLQRMDQASKAGADAMLDGAAAGSVTLDELRAFTDLQRTGLTQLFNDLPVLAKPVAEDSLELLRRIDVNATGVVTATPAGAPCDCPDDLSDAMPISALGRSRTSPTQTAVNRPGSGSAVTKLGCDCVELPGGSSAREPSRTDGTKTKGTDGTKDGGEKAPDEEPPFTPTGGTLTDPETDDDDGAGNGAIVTRVEQLPLGELSETVGGATGVNPDTSVVDRLARAADSQTAP